MTVALFYQFLAARILERVQQISKEVCRGCVLQYKFHNLHPCEINSLPHRVEMFLASAKTEALEKLASLLKSFQRNFTLFQEEDIYLEEGYNFLQDLQPRDIIGVSYIDEETESKFGIDSSWREPEADPLAQTYIDAFSAYSSEEEGIENTDEEISATSSKITCGKKRKSSRDSEWDISTPMKKRYTNDILIEFNSSKNMIGEPKKTLVKSGRKKSTVVVGDTKTSHNKKR